jgi:hypothetical protein
MHKATQKATKKDDCLFRRADKAGRCVFIEVQLEGPQTISGNDDCWVD